MNSNDIMDYMRNRLSQICNEKNNRNRQSLITEILCELQDRLESFEENSFIAGQDDILRKVLISNRGI